MVINIHVIMVVVLGYKLIGSHSGVKICRWTKVCRDSSRAGFSITSKSHQNDVITSTPPEIIRKPDGFLMISGGNGDCDVVLVPLMLTLKLFHVFS